MRVVQITRSLDPTRGISYVAHHLAREFCAAGLPVTSVTWFPGVAGASGRMGECRTAPRLARLSALFRNPRLRLVVEVPLFTLWASLTARRLRRRGDVLLSHGDSLIGDVYVAHSCHRAAVAVKRSAGERGWAFFPLHWFVLLREAWNFGRGRRPYLVAISRGVAQEYERYYGVPAERIFFIPNGVDRARYRPADDRAALRRELGLPERERLLLFVGHEFARKGLRLVIEGLASCRSAAQPVLLVVGADRPGAYRDRARALGVADRVRFLGPRSDLWRLYPACDLFVFLSNYEACPLVGLEALASGLPILTTRVNGMEDFVRDGENGLFVERDAQAFAAALERLLDDDGLFARLQANARPSSEPYDWPRIAQQYREAFERILAEGA